VSQKLAHKILAPVFRKNPALKLAYRLYRQLKTNKAYFKQPQMTPLGFKFNGNPVMEAGLFEPSETQLVKQLLSQVSTVINVGANIGYYCCFALQQGKRVIAFEPIPSNLHFLLRNIKANHWESMTEVFPLALSNNTGVLEIYGEGTGASLIEGWAGNPKDDVTLVPVTTLDRVLGGYQIYEKILFIIDIEGAEKMMLDGAADFLRMDPKPIWFVEISSTQHQPTDSTMNPYWMETFEHFWGAGYQAWNVGETVRFVSRADIEEVFKIGHKTALESANYLFAASEDELRAAGVSISK
jgi:FkbM family methyltransferase